MIGVTFGDYHSYDDLSLILNSKIISAPEPKVETLDVPGADGVLDFTEAFGGVKYNNRQLVFNFTQIAPSAYFPTAQSNISNKLNGTKCEIVLDEDADFFYIGRLTVGEIEENKGFFTFSVTADCEPYKMRRVETTVIRNVDTHQEITLRNRKKSVVPTISTSAEINLSWLGGSASLSAGNNQIVPEFVLNEGINIVTVTGNAVVTFKYREGEL